MERYVLVDRTMRSVPMYYQGMICGIVTQVTQEVPESKIFGSPQEALQEKEEYSTCLRHFAVEVIDNNADSK